MRTILDDSKTWFLQGVTYEEGLNIVLVEGVVGGEPEDIEINGVVIRNTYPINSTPISKIVSIRFSRFVAWQVVNESFTCFEEYEKRDDECFFQVLERSKYFDYVNDSHGWYADVIGAGKHYRVWTENEVIDVVTIEEPTIELVNINS